MPFQTHRIVELSTIIAENTKLIDDYLTAKGIATPTLDWTGSSRQPVPSDEPDAGPIEAARHAVMEATDELHAIMKGPKELLRVRWTKNVALHAIARFDIVNSFPVGETTTFAAIAKKVGLKESIVRRLLRQGMHDHLFAEPKEGYVVHTALTKALVEDPLIVDNVIAQIEEWNPSALKVVEALRRFPDAQEPSQSAFAIANNAVGKTMFEFYAENPERSLVFSKAMTSVNSQQGHVASFLIRGFPWKDLGKATVVDVGGSHGSVAVELARQLPDLTFYVQDLPNVIQEAKGKIPADVSQRITLQPHDFFTPQPISADAYYARSILHDWPDKYAIKILQSLEPALKPGARFLVHELVMAPPNVLPKEQDRYNRDLDIGMLQLLNATQRDQKEWMSLFERASPKWEFVKVHVLGGAQSLVEFRWAA